MWVAERKPGEAISIEAFDAEGNPVEIKVSVGRSTSKGVRIGIEAPKSINLRRVRPTNGAGNNVADRHEDRVDLR
jgi:sRNA-binding carbon storage regulator CsrA